MAIHAAVHVRWF